MSFVCLLELRSAFGRPDGQAAITGLRKRGQEISCKRTDGITRYSVRSSHQ
jgi:hypothetical protein